MQANGFGGAHRTEWPDGQALIEQPAITVEMFALIAEENAKACQET